MKAKLFLIAAISLSSTPTVSAQWLTQAEKEKIEVLKNNVANRNNVVFQELPVKTDDSPICENPEVQPSFYGNIKQWLSQNVTYPSVAAENGIQGQVLVEFIVEKDGGVSNVKIARAVEPALDYEAVRVAKSMPKWKPGYNNGVPVRVICTLPISFKLQ